MFPSAKIVAPSAALREVLDAQRVRELAAQIPTRELYARILDDCDPALRDQVDAMLRPHLPFDPDLTDAEDPPAIAIAPLDERPLPFDPDQGL